MTETRMAEISREIWRLRGRVTLLEKLMEKPLAEDIDMKTIAKKVCNEFEIDIDKLIGKRRLQNIVSARKVFSFIAIQKGYRMTAIGRFLNRGHDDISRYYSNFDAFLQGYPEYSNETYTCLTHFDINIREIREGFKLKVG